MKKYRPHNLGFIVIYVLTFLCVAESVYTVVRQINGTLNDLMSSFSTFSHLITLAAIAYMILYGRSRIEIDQDTFHYVNPAYVPTPKGEARSFFLFRQGALDLRTVDKRFPLKSVQQFGYAEDLSLGRQDKSDVDEKNRFLPVHEVVFITNEGRHYHVNFGFYNSKQIRGMLAQIRQATHLTPVGKLAGLCDAAD